MRTTYVLALATGVAIFSAAEPQSAAAFGWHDPDRYNYSYEPRGYYPYYNSGYWGPPRVKRYQGELPPYFSSWGAPDQNYSHVEWHERNYGGHRRGHW
ncbi:MAG: hypothetical protein ACT4OU_06805 [Hyphomicrobium sp.]